MPPTAVSRQLAERIAAFRFQELSPDFVAHAKLVLRDPAPSMTSSLAPPRSEVCRRRGGHGRETEGPADGGACLPGKLLPDETGPVLAGMRE